MDKVIWWWACWACWACWGNTVVVMMDGLVTVMCMDQYWWVRWLEDLRWWALLLKYKNWLKAVDLRICGGITANLQLAALFLGLAINFRKIVVSFRGKKTVVWKWWLLWYSIGLTVMHREVNSYEGSKWNLITMDDRQLWRLHRLS